MDILIKHTFPNDAGILVSFKRPLTMDSTRKKMMEHLREKYHGTVQLVNNMFAFVSLNEDFIETEKED